MNNETNNTNNISIDKIIEMLNNINLSLTNINIKLDNLNKEVEYIEEKTDTDSKIISQQSKQITELKQQLTLTIMKSENTILDAVYRNKSEQINIATNRTPIAKRDDIDDEQLKADYNEGMTLKELSNKYSMSVPGIRNRLITLGVYQMKYKKLDTK